MALLKYFKRTESSTESTNSKGSTFPDPSSPLSKIVPSTSIEESNKEVTALIVESRDKKHGPYVIVSLEHKARVGKYAADHGTTDAIRHFAKDFPNLHESTVRGWKTAYLKEVCVQVKAGVDEVSVERLPEVPKGRPLLLGKQLDQQVREYLNALRDAGSVVNTSMLLLELLDDMTAICLQ